MFLPFARAYNYCFRLIVQFRVDEVYSIWLAIVVLLSVKTFICYLAVSTQLIDGKTTTVLCCLARTILLIHFYAPHQLVK